MVMLLYHGSNVRVEVVDLARSKPFKDFGRGFYLTADRRQAERMAQRVFALAGEGTPEVTCFSFDERLLSSGDLNCLIFEGYSAAWARFVAENRDVTRESPEHGYDVVYGPIADDWVSLQIRSFLEGEHDVDALVRKLQYAKGVTYQYYFGTARAVEMLVLQ